MGLEIWIFSRRNSLAAQVPYEFPPTCLGRRVRIVESDSLDICPGFRGPVDPRLFTRQHV